MKLRKLNTSLKRWISGVAIAALACGGLVVGATAASAHAGNIKVIATECVDANTMTATYKIGWSAGTPTGKLYTKSGLLNSSNSWKFEQNTSTTEGSTTVTKTYKKSDFTGTNSKNGPWMSFKVVFTDNINPDGDTRVEGFDWSKCTPVKPPVASGTDTVKDDFCTEPADGTRTYTVKTTPWTQDWVLKDGKWVPGEKISGKTKTTTSSEQDATCRPDQPKTLTGKDVVKDDLCTEPADGTRTYTETTTPWTQEYVWKNGGWVKGEKVNGTPTTKTTTEDDATCRPDQPKTLTGKDVVKDDFCTEPADGTRTYTETTTPWTQEYVWGKGEWVLGDKVEGTATTKTSTADEESCWTPVSICYYNEQTSTWEAQVIPDDRQKPEGATEWTEGSPENCWTPQEICVLNEADGTWSQQTVADDKTLTGDEVLADNGCPGPYVQVCIQGDEGWGPSAWLAVAPPESKLWTGRSIDCYPPVTLCVPGDGLDVANTQLTLSEEAYQAGDYPEGAQVWAGDLDGTGGCTPPTLAGSAVVGVCEAGVPYLDWTVALKDLDGNSTNNTSAVVTFVHPGTDRLLDKSYTVDLTDGQGSNLLLWPGASEVDGVATGWPGWAQLEDGAWTNVGDLNYGWTRDGVTVNIEVNPEVDLTVDYPQESPLCDGPSIEVDEVLGAPPLPAAPAAVAVVAVAQFAG